MAPSTHHFYGQTYYLTMDLSYPEFKSQSVRMPQYGRGGYYKARQSTGRSRGQTSTKLRRDAVQNTSQEGLDPASNDTTAHDEGQGDGDAAVDMAENTASQRQDKGKGIDLGTPQPHLLEAEGMDEDGPESVQILELHSQNPIISYRGRIFEGDWSEIIGTEAIFTRHDPDTPLPALRNLADGIDLLGASAAKITTKEKFVQLRQPDEPDSLADIKKEWNIRIPVGRDNKAKEKAAQARFLENLIAVKMKKGETDHVTVYAKPPEGGTGSLSKTAEVKTRGRRKPTEKPRGPRAAKRARTQPRWDHEVESTAEGSMAGEGSLSTPTPIRWADLITLGGMDDDQAGRLREGVEARESDSAAPDASERPGDDSNMTS